MRIGICCDKQETVSGLISVIFACKCKFSKISDFSLMTLKNNELVIIDLDNYDFDKSELEKFVKLSPEIIFIGISNNLELLNEYRGVLNVELKPLSSTMLNSYISKVTNMFSSDLLYNRDIDKIYSECGELLSSSYRKEELPEESSIDEIIQEVNNPDFQGTIDIPFADDINLEEELIEPPISILYAAPVQYKKDTALDKYRRKKLAELYLSPDKIDEYIKKLNAVDFSDKKKVDTYKQQKNDILSKLKSGYFREAAAKSRENSKTQESPFPKKENKKQIEAKETVAKPDEVKEEKPKEVKKDLPAGIPTTDAGVKKEPIVIDEAPATPAIPIKQPEPIQEKPKLNKPADTKPSAAPQKDILEVIQDLYEEENTEGNASNSYERHLNGLSYNKDAGGNTLASRIKNKTENLLKDGTQKTATPKENINKRIKPPRR